ncbi:hypothetical protein KDN34_17240 [Shewanella yunxiaonensis]|uniref:Uncharacterized protein n=1 Tax=Shewanella yunxiaonensis TaxID=2829809 RepID=A0ABX7YU73_9GAMM|nr:MULTISPECIES: hypothetical protein [Shewanella]MDF0536049.1 hypothetical protein [Shewanella sp. A32]QUN05884.1 hypothetical protein KDN34_17240 [Shewanella yunxiaonensis]
MRGWIILAVLAAIVYYLATKTDKLDEPIAKSEALLNKIERKLDAMTGTQIIRIDQKRAKLRSTLGERLSNAELQELNKVLESPDTFSDFKDEYCRSDVMSHPVFSKDNLQFICDNF